MAIAEDASTPAVVTVTGKKGVTATTATFSPPANSYLVAIVSLGYKAASGSVNLNLSDSAGHTWTQGPFSTDGDFDFAAIYTTYLSSAPGSITVTAQNNDTSGNQGIQLAVRVVTGAAVSQSGAASNTASAGRSNTLEGSITTTTAGSWVYVAGCLGNTGTLTAAAGTTTIQTFNDTSDGEAFGAGRQTSATGSPGATSLGWTASTTTSWAWAALEILPATGSTPPAVTTNAASGVTSTGATLNGTVNPESATTTYAFNWGTTIAYGNTTTTGNAGSGSSGVSESFALSGLNPSTTYHYRVTATNAGGTTNGSDQSFTTSAASSITIAQTVTGSVQNDYGLDNVPFTMVNPCIPASGSMGNWLVAFIGWDIAFYPYQSSGNSPAVNVTDSQGNLWRQVGITSENTGSRAAIWVCPNARQVSWISVAVTGWTYSTTYTIVEIAGLPSTMQTVSIDFVQQAVTNSPVTTLSTTSGTATTTDLVLGMVGVGTNSSLPTTPSGWSPLTSAPLGPTQYIETIFPYWIQSEGAGTVAFAPSWANAGPAAALIVGLKQTAPAPTQSNPNFPEVVIEAAFGANPGDWTQSVDYTWSIEGITWTDITTRCITSEGETRVEVSRGRQYELSSEEAGEIRISLDNHDGVFTSGNTASPYYPNVIPGVPIRVTAWWTQVSGNPVQYPVGFGYIERWPQNWPDLPQWGFTEVVATDAYGPLGSTTLPAAVEGDIRKDYPYAYFPTDEQYSFTQTSLELAGVKTPIDCNGFPAINKAFGNNRVAAYRDGSDGTPANVGQALNLLGDEDTAFGYPNYAGQVASVGGPGMYYYDPNLPTNTTGNEAFSIEFWFLLGWGATTYACTLLSLFGLPSTYYDPGNSYSGNGAILTVGAGTVNKTPGLYVNGTLVGTTSSNPAFTAENVNPQHFVITNSPVNGTTCYLNGTKCALQPTTLGNFSVARAIVLGPGRYSYDNNSRVTYQGYNFVTGHLAVYPQELTPTMINNHYASGITGYVGTSAPRRFAQVLTWGLLGLKRGGTAWTGGHGTVENTQISEAYSYEGTSAGDVMGQLVQTEFGRCYTQGNGSLVYVTRWNLYNQPQSVVFGDTLATLPGSTASPEIPFEQDTSFDLDNTYIYNTIQATQNRGPNTDIVVQQVNSASQLSYFNRSGLQLQSYAMSPFDVYGAVNWSSVKYNSPIQRVESIEVNVASLQGGQPGAFAAILGLELQDAVTVNRRPIGGTPISVAGPIQQLDHSIGADEWTVKYQISPRYPDSNVLTTDNDGWGPYSTTGTPSAQNYFIISSANALTINPGDQFTDTKNAGTTFTVENVGAPSGGNVNITFTPNATTIMSSDTVSQLPYNTLGSNYLAW